MTTEAMNKVLEIPTSQKLLLEMLNEIVRRYNDANKTDLKVHLTTAEAIVTTSSSRIFAKLAFPLDATKNGIYQLSGEWYTPRNSREGDYVVAWLKGSPIRYLCQRKEGETLNISDKTLKGVKLIHAYDNVETLLIDLRKIEEQLTTPITSKQQLDVW